MKQLCSTANSQAWGSHTAHFQPLSALHSQLLDHRSKRVLEVNGRDLSQMMTHMLAHIASQPTDGRWIALIAPPSLPLAKIIRAHGIRPEQVLMVHPKDATDTLWAVERALQSGTCAAVLAWPDEISERDIRRLQLAAGKRDTLSVLFTLNRRDPERAAGYRVLAEQTASAPWHSRGICVNNRFASVPSHTFH